MTHKSKKDSSWAARSGVLGPVSEADAAHVLNILVSLIAAARVIRGEGLRSLHKWLAFLGLAVQAGLALAQAVLFSKELFPTR